MWTGSIPPAPRFRTLALLETSVLVTEAWPWRAAVWRAVLPRLSSISTRAPEDEWWWWGGGWWVQWTHVSYMFNVHVYNIIRITWTPQCTMYVACVHTLYSGWKGFALIHTNLNDIQRVSLLRTTLTKAKLMIRWKTANRKSTKKYWTTADFEASSDCSALAKERQVSPALG